MTKGQAIQEFTTSVVIWGITTTAVLLGGGWLYRNTGNLLLINVGGLISLAAFAWIFVRLKSNMKSADDR